MGYSIKYIKYIKYSGLGMDSNQFLWFFDIFGQFGAKLWKCRWRNDQHFSKKSFSYESSGQTPKLKSFVYGSSNHDLFEKKSGFDR